MIIYKILRSDSKNIVTFNVEENDELNTETAILSNMPFLKGTAMLNNMVIWSMHNNAPINSYKTIGTCDDNGVDVTVKIKRTRCA
ncbi:hypothetical protein J6A31_09105 [bacterium]|nr:hypothetical protein [bacterium]